MRRSPLTILVLTVAVVGGISLGMMLIGRHAAGRAPERERALWPDLTAQHATPAELAKLGFKLTGKEPASWSDISVRLYQDQRGTVTLLRCVIDPAEAGGLVRFPLDSRRPAADRPPADWPWGEAGDPARVPEWWQPAGRQSRIYDRQAKAGLSSGIFANYDPKGRILHFWAWQLRDWFPHRADPLDSLVADEAATAIDQELRSSGHPFDAEGWFHAAGLAPDNCGLPRERLPAGLVRVDAVLFPVDRRHRYFLALHGLDQATAWRVVGEYPLRDLPADGAPPLDRWPFAGLPIIGNKPVLPTWFTPGPGPRRAHCLIRIGDGLVEAGRWVAYDTEAKVLYIWDWAGPSPQAATADLCP